MKKALLIVLAIIFVLIPFITWTSSIVKNVKFDANCGDYLRLAADANDITIAEKHLTTAISYLEDNNITSGYTKVFVYKPANDIGLWYENLKTAQSQLQEMKTTEYTELEESNMLMKLRETILTNEGYLTHPFGISLVPNYNLMFWLNCLLWLPCWAISIVLVVLCYDY